MTAGRAAGSSERYRGGLAHVPALDGLRGLSVAAVLAYHSHWTWARGGFLGVSAFFTLSGFLITTLLLDEHRRAGRIAIGPFLLRRVRRLLPAATTTVVAVVLLGLAGVWDTAQRSAVHSGAPAALLQLANWEMIRSPRSYADLFSAPSPLQHFWSLAIEEQFYWVFPTLLALALVARRPPRRLLAAALATAALASTAAAVMLSSHSDLDRLYLGTDTRMAELFVGASLAALSHRRLRVGGHRGAVLAASVGGASLVGIVIAWTRVDLATLALYRGGLLVHALAVAAVITTAVRRGPVTKLLSVRPLTLLGRLSYSVYLVHWPVFVMVDRYEGRLGTFGTNAVRLGATCALAAVMYRFVETPIRRPAGRGGARDRAGNSRHLRGARRRGQPGCVPVDVGLDRPVQRRHSRPVGVVEHPGRSRAGSHHGGRRFGGARARLGDVPGGGRAACGDHRRHIGRLRHAA
jgi:peptidoglycan/LPS O-acetylase OafA/YrhL